MILTAPCTTVHDKLCQSQTSPCHNLGNWSESLSTAIFLTASFDQISSPMQPVRTQDNELTLNFLPIVAKIQVQISTTTFHMLLLDVCHDCVY